MSKRIALQPNKKITRVAIIIKQAKGLGQLFEVRKFLRKQGLQEQNISVDQENMTVFVDDTNKKEIQIFIDRFKRGLSYAGHGGYRISFEIKELEVNLIDVVKEESLGKQKTEIKKINEQHRKEQEAWSVKQTKLNKRLEREIELKTLYRDDAKRELKRLKIFNEKYKATKNELDSYQVPTYQIVLRRFKEFIK